MEERRGEERRGQDRRGEPRGEPCAGYLFAAPHIALDPSMLKMSKQHKGRIRIIKKFPLIF